ncbi:DUF3048 domain-containing protein [Alkalicoccus chagannorensis]|uniref:DUF3048 domain-containing protein n=1 Tax=Alkalicoccus chagannorensis TaxID=427072 RepID=UPI000421129A|nr:DUF3048 domain-containing protein [Alkalicoccus chagannorensis]
MKKTAWLCGILLAAGCSGAENNENNMEEEAGSTAENAAVSNENNANNNEEAQDPEDFDYTFPLTGLGAEEDPDHRAFGVMIENAPQARPYAGVEEADVVMEVLSEGDITRLLAVFHSSGPDVIGSVRSARDYYIDLNNGFDALYVSAGGSPAAFEMFQSGEVDFINGLEYDGVHFERYEDRSAPHDLFTSWDGLLDAAEDSGRDIDTAPPELNFAEEEAPLEDDVESLEIAYGGSSGVTFTYDEEEGGYLRSVDGEPMEDLETGDPVAPRNVLIAEAPHDVVDDEGRRDIDVEAGGDAYLAYDGTVVRAAWENQDGVIVPVDDEGEPIPLQPGQTWISITEEDLDNYVDMDGAD